GRRTLTLGSKGSRRKERHDQTHSSMRARVVNGGSGHLPAWRPDPAGRDGERGARIARRAAESGGRTRLQRLQHDPAAGHPQAGLPSTAAAIRVVTCGGTWETWIY